MRIKDIILNIFNYEFSREEIYEINRLKFNKKFYTPLDEAIKEIENRRKDKDLIKKIETYIGEIPEPFNESVCAVMFRFVASPQEEMIEFFKRVNQTNLKPSFWEYYDDKYHSGNFCKYSLGKLLIHKGVDKNFNNIFKIENVIDINTSNGKKIKEIKTLNGESFIDFHHNLFYKVVPVPKNSLYDASDWFKIQGGSADVYYKKFLSLFLVHGILFENFLLDDKDDDFTKKVFIPAFLDVQKKFGLKPLIVELLDTGNFDSDKFWKFWSSYPSYIDNML